MLMPLENVVKFIEECAAKVGLVHSSEQVALRDLHLGHKWESSYARLLAIFVPKPDLVTFNICTEVGCEWLDETPIASGDRIDNYLLLIVTETPSKEMREAIRAIELDPTICRKHVAWPEDTAEPDLKWARILRVTVLGVPTSPIATGMTGSPTLESDLHRQLLEDIKQYKGRAAARRHAENPSWSLRP
jgi:hypothetical protein